MVQAQTTAGWVRGAVHDGVVVFRGVPYAAPPIGELRFCPPQPTVPWSGLRDATAQAPACPQPALPRLFDKLDPSGPATKFVERYDEDCLTVNVFTPDTQRGARPVLVWLHGGWFSVGSGNEPCYDGSNLCRSGDVVVVTVNHRLGALGFLSLTGRGDDDYVESAANNGLLDVVAALEWVRDNIAEFGGDPASVTAFGESGGAAKVSMLLGVKRARGLFHRAIVQSGPMLRAVPAERAQASAAALFAELGSTSIGELRSLPVSAVVRAQNIVLGGPLGGLYGDGHRMAPTVDGRVIDGHPFDPVAAAASQGVSLMIGSCRDEASMMVATIPGIDAMEPDQQVQVLADNVFGHALDELVEHYARTRPTSTVAERFLAVVTDQIRIGGITMAERVTAAGAQVHMYRVDHVPSVYGGKLGAPHTIDVGFAFANTDAGAGITSPNRGLYQDRDVARLTREISGAWIAFARTGDPGHRELPPWPSYEVNGRATMIFGAQSGVINDPDSDERLIWKGRDGGM
ncbi:carboxylesterase family protein [Mycobacterium sp.]|uniref:carboxylesterase/lipase family protein n=1 Tax=Mycobacterium sp. TaxID=1785 RepID=UPI00261F618A|nr:carboxylesterase family protein [Mycobacterium sp.]